MIVLGINSSFRLYERASQSSSEDEFEEELLELFELELLDELELLFELEFREEFDELLELRLELQLPRPSSSRP
ncbi:hypothetical protein N184_22855 [Sinorhizobium sp. GL28]|nr:hypothetical protein N184_22855 [Sinorhizobium sp. GL28]